MLVGDGEQLRAVVVHVHGHDYVREVVDHLGPGRERRLVPVAIAQIDVGRVFTRQFTGLIGLEEQDLGCVIVVHGPVSDGVFQFGGENVVAKHELAPLARGQSGLEQRLTEHVVRGYQMVLVAERSVRGKVLCATVKGRYRCGVARVSQLVTLMVAILVTVHNADGTIGSVL